MKLKTLWLVVFAVVLCAAPAGTFACSTPPTLTITYSWPGWTGGTDDVNVIPGNVPGGPVSTAISNWNNGLLAFCYPPFLQESTVGATGTINMSYASIPPPSNCPSGSTCYTRGITDLPDATITNGRISSVNVTVNSAVTNTSAITEVVAHEFGHTFGLADCSGCSTGSSVMVIGSSAAPATSINSLIGQPGPTSCDIKCRRYRRPRL